MKRRDFHYDLPDELIAQRPLERRGDSRLLHLRSDGEAIDRHFPDLLDLLRPDDLLVLNVTTSAGWEPLCNFLGVPVPDEPFPNVNKAAGINIFNGLNNMDSRITRLINSIKFQGTIFDLPER